MKSIRMMLVTLMLAMFASTALAQRGNIPSFGGVTASISLDSGFLFIDNEYIPSPYAITLNEGELTINGQDIAVDAFDLSSYRGYSMGRQGGGRRGDRGSQRRPNGAMGGDESRDWGASKGSNAPADEEADAAVSQFAMRQLFNEFELLRQDAVIVLRSGAKPMVIGSRDTGYELLKVLLVIPENQMRLAGVPDNLRDEVDHETWRQLVGSFQSTPVFVASASKYIDEVDLAQRQIEAQLASVQWSERLSYPLTMVALVLVVAGLGHLMASAHEVFSAALNRQDTAELSKNIVLLLVIMAAMSAIDLVWTVMAHNNGAMRELNPIGSMLIDDTTKLIAFKMIVTGLSIGLLFWQRRLPLTRKATWWCCLTMTLLTVRWLSFHSMLV